MGLSLKRRYLMLTSLKVTTLCGCLLLLSGCGQKYLSSETSNECWTCALYKTVIIEIDKFTSQTLTLLIPMALQVLGVGILFYLLFKIAQLLTSIKQPNLAKFYLSTGTVLFKALLVGAVLWVPPNQDPAAPIPYVELLGEHVVQPVLKLFLITSDEILASSRYVSEQFYIPDSVLEAQLGDAPESFMFGDISLIIQELIYRMFVALSTGMSAGIWFLSMGSFAGTIIGLIVVVSFFWMLIIFPMAFIESLVRLGIILVVSPFIFVAWVFPWTQGYMQKLWSSLFSCLFNLLFSCIFLSFYIYVIFSYAKEFMPYNVLNSAVYDSDVSYRNDVLSFATAPVSFFILLFAMNKMYDNLTKIASYFGGDGQESGFKRVVNGVKDTAIGAAKTAAGAVLVGVSSGAVGRGLLASGAQDLSAVAGKGMNAVTGKGESNLGANDTGSTAAESQPVASPAQGGEE